ncbi:MAG: signal peptidase I [Parcubacteria group bacterium]|nr:signal peptidase I [Parcubacteria group bacterium]
MESNPETPLDNSIVSEKSRPPFIRSFFLFLWEVVKVVIIALAIILPLRAFIAQPFLVSGQSMQPSFHDGDYLIIDELSYRLRDPLRGEVVVLRFPRDPSQFYIKRIVGLPGETVSIREGVVTIVNSDYPAGFTLREENYLEAETVTQGNLILTLGEDQYFVLGDNRAQSSDSRSWGALDRRFVIGRAWLGLFPLERLQVFRAFDYSDL